MSFSSPSTIPQTFPVALIVLIYSVDHQRVNERIPVMSSVWRQLRETFWVIRYHKRDPIGRRRWIKPIYRVFELRFERELIWVFDNVIHWVCPVDIEAKLRSIDLTATKIVSPSTTEGSDNG